MLSEDQRRPDLEDVGIRPRDSNETVGDAFAPFAQWDGRNVHMSGDITWTEIPNPEGEGTITVPVTAPGYFRIN
jgi:hypothetical protein